MNAPAPNKKTLAERLGGVRVAARRDLKASRHIFSGNIAYVLSDPVTFESHRISASDYVILTSLSLDKTLAETFRSLCTSGTLRAENEETFYRFVASFQQRGLLTLPVTNTQSLFEQHERRRAAQSKGNVLRFLYLPMSLMNPDRFLDRTILVGKLLYSQGAFVLWVLLMLLAGKIVLHRWSDFIDPVSNVAITKYWPLLWACFTVLKVIHEFGHAYACKRFGGNVTDMGFVLVALNPCAYVDCSAAWSFPSKWHRIIVSFGGMYIESIVAAIALIVWNATPPGLLNSTAHYLVVIAGFITLVFNLNPLIKFDGYFVLCDLIGVPNLKMHADNQVLTLAKRIFLGLKKEPSSTFRYSPWLLLYGVLSSLYKVSVVVGMSSMMASRYLAVGIVMAGLYLLTMLGGSLGRLFKYLWWEKETEPVRLRAIAASVLLFVGAPVTLWLVPMFGGIRMEGSVSKLDEQFIRVRNAGVVKEIAAQEGETIASGQTLFSLENMEVASQQNLRAADLRRATHKYFASQVRDHAAAAQELQRLSFQHQQLLKSQLDARSLSVTAERPGIVLQNVSLRQQGTFLPAGGLAAVVGDGPWVVRAIADSEQMVHSRPMVGQEVQCKLAAFPGRTLMGRVVRVAETGSRQIAAQQLTQLGGGDIAVNPQTHEAGQAYFEITIELPAEHDIQKLRRGMTATISFGNHYDSVGSYLLRRALLFWNNLSKESAA